MKKLMICALAATTFFTSCSNDSDEKFSTLTPQDGAQATMILKMAFPRTYADNTATTVESKVNNVDVFIFDGTTGSLVNHVPLTESNFTTSGNEYTSSTGIVTTAGARKIGVGINLPTAIVSKITSQKNADAVNANTVYAVTASMIASENAFVMFSTELTAETLVADDVATPGDNEITMEIERMAGKAAMAKTSTFTTSAVDAMGTFGDLEYKLMQTNKKSFLMRESALTSRKDPNYLSSDYVTASPTGSQYDATDFESATTYKVIGAANAYTDHSLRPAFYGAENTADFYLKGATTYFVVRGQFTPTTISNASGTSKGSGVVNNDFWIVTDGTTTHFCDDAVEAGTLGANATIFTAGPVTVTKHENGYCYWAVFVGNANERSFLRNNYYLGQVQAITGFGEGDEDKVIDPPTDPVDGSKSTLKVIFDILDWTFQAADPVELD